MLTWFWENKVLPLVGTDSPLRIFNSVDFPAPLWPSIAVIWPSYMSNTKSRKKKKGKKGGRKKGRENSRETGRKTKSQIKLYYGANGLPFYIIEWPCSLNINTMGYYIQNKNKMCFYQFICLPCFEILKLCGFSAGYISNTPRFIDIAWNMAGWMLIFMD